MLSIYIVFSNCLGSCWWSPRRHVLFVFSGAFSKLDEKLKEDNWLSSLGAQKKSDGLDMKHGHFQSERIDEDRLGPHSFFGVPCGGGGGGPKNIYGGSHAIHGWLERTTKQAGFGEMPKTAALLTCWTCWWLKNTVKIQTGSTYKGGGWSQKELILDFVSEISLSCDPKRHGVRALSLSEWWEMRKTINEYKDKLYKQSSKVT